MTFLLAFKVLAISNIIFALLGASIGTGILFGCYVIAASKNPEEADTLFNSTLLGFALIETFVFMSFIVAIIVYLL